MLLNSDGKNTVLKIIDNRKEYVFTIRQCFEDAGQALDFNDPNDVARLEIGAIKSMENLGYVYAGKRTKNLKLAQ